MVDDVFGAEVAAAAVGGVVAGCRPGYGWPGLEVVSEWLPVRVGERLPDQGAAHWRVVWAGDQ